MSTNFSVHDKRVMRSKKLLHEALLSLLKNNALKDITVLNIVQEADVNRGTFYNHYQYKGDLLQEIKDEVIADLIYCIRNPYKDKVEFEISDLSLSTIGVFDHVESHRSFYTLLLTEDALASFLFELSNHIKSTMVRDCYLVNCCPDLNMELHAQFIANGLTGLIIGWVKNNFTYSTSYMTEQLMKILSDGKVYRKNVAVPT